MANLITGLFDSTSAAENAVNQLKQIGYAQNEVNIIMKDRGAAETVARRTGGGMRQRLSPVHWLRQLQPLLTPALACAGSS